MKRKLEFFVPGIPKPGGSKTVFHNKKTGQAMVVDACKQNKDWRASVAHSALAALGAQRTLLAGPLCVNVCFIMPRPKAHYGSKGIKDSAARFHVVKPDATKLWRSTEDALTGIIWRDDSEIVVQRIAKEYGEIAGAQITIEEM